MTTTTTTTVITIVMRNGTDVTISTEDGEHLINLLALKMEMGGVFTHKEDGNYPTVIRMEDVISIVGNEEDTEGEDETEVEIEYPKDCLCDEDVNCEACEACTAGAAGEEGEVPSDEA
jgi:hypothetical protein